MCSVAKGPFGKIEDMFYFNWQEVAIALIKLKGIHQGHWRVGLQFDLHGATANIPLSKTSHTKVPAAFVPVINVNLKQVKAEDVDELTIDAAEVNPMSRLLVPASIN